MPPTATIATDAAADSKITTSTPHDKSNSIGDTVINNNNNSSRNIVKNSTPVSIRAKNELDRRLLVAATEGNIAYLDSVRRDGNPKQGRSSIRDNDNDCGTKVLRDAVCVSGCTLLHWAAGSNQVKVLEYLLSPLTDPSGEETGGDRIIPAIFCDRKDDPFCAVDLPVTRCKKSLGRTPLHYACRNGCLEAVRWLVLVGGASISVQAKQGVTPFQLAVWQNRLEICVFLTGTPQRTKGLGTNAEGDDCFFDPSKDFNDFGCGAVHWLGIAPESRSNCHRIGDHNIEDNNDGRDLLPLARWLASLPGIDFEARQRQNHTALHKASWGGHLALVEYLHEEHNMWDDVVDDAGNYAASLADMAHTPKHSKIANYLRHHCSRKRTRSLTILGLLEEGTKTTTAVAPGKDQIRKAYLAKARQLHPDRLVARASEANGKSNDDTGGITIGGKVTNSDVNQGMGTGAASFDELRKAYLHLTEEDGVGDQSNPAHSLNLMLRYVNNNDKSTARKDTNPEEEEDTFFKARLVAVLLEYGDKGIDLSNVKKKWKQVWPEIPFPSQQRKSSQQQQAKKIPMAEFLLQKAGDVIRFERHGDRNRRVLVLLKNKNSSKESVLRSGSVSTETSKPAIRGQLQ